MCEQGLPWLHIRSQIVAVRAHCIVWYRFPEAHIVWHLRVPVSGCSSRFPASGFQVLLQGVGSLLSGPTPAEKRVSPATLHWVLLLLSVVVLVKFGLFLLCRASRNDIVQAYATVG